MLRRLLIVSALALTAAAPAWAGDVRVTLGFRSGALLLRAPAASASYAAPTTVSVTVADGRGTGAGWVLRLSSGRPVLVTSITARCAAGSTCTLPRPAGGATGAAILRTARDSGMGVMALTVTVARLAAGTPRTAVSFSVSPR
jgi:hypothetical protein